MSQYDLIVIGSSAGGILALIEILSALPKDFSIPLCIVQHIPPARPSKLPAILTHRGKLLTSHPSSGAQLTPGHVFIAPPDHHLSIYGLRVAVTQDLPQRHRPSVNILFESAASSYGSRLIGVILTGMLTDGTVGLQAVKRNGGKTIIQDPEEAAYPSMPRSAQKHCVIDACLPLLMIGPFLQKLENS